MAELLHIGSSFHFAATSLQLASCFIFQNAKLRLMSDSDQLGFTFEAQPQRRVWTVRDLMSAVRTRMEREFTDVWIEGEISNYRPAESGHLYFTLKDEN